MPELPVGPRWDAEAGRYDWSQPSPPAPQALEPAFVREAISAIDPQAANVTVRSPGGVTTFADVYPRGTKDHAPTDAPSIDDEAPDEPGDEWRMPSSVADDLLISLPEGTPRMVRTFLTLLMGAMRRG
jgi:hypothetical protein